MHAVSYHFIVNMNDFSIMSSYQIKTLLYNLNHRKDYVAEITRLCLVPSLVTQLHVKAGNRIPCASSGSLGPLSRHLQVTQRGNGKVAISDLNI